MLIKKIIRFFDKLENKVRGKLSHYPILYAFIGGVGIVLFWRGVWHIADDTSVNSILSLIIGSVLLLITGIFVSAFVGSKLIISGLVGERKIEEKEEKELQTEEMQLKNLQETLKRIEEKLEHIDQEVEEKK
ncbi:MAG: hypothetical protein UU13_C0017G0009 [Candidatus Nomurabacteria bacterium GW2011_GWB1_40_7]|uniref:Uncharacterized protein n=1 Tax=Candidatus Nomurabacteria bacterium GW2011_GWB1_40_7 TaxID=1618744 RepID=A0A0G0SYV0_9BACT|nr:MAG: hypothetical protein UU13_C0017G0009 [Candidatus Nomurabacteria bacterium GW2011_GWB1_40_7]